MNTRASIPRVLIVVVTMAALTASAVVTTNVNVARSGDGGILAGVAIFDSSDNSTAYPNGFTVRTGRERELFAGKVPPGIGTRTFPAAFDGRVAAFYDSGELTFCQVDRSGFTFLATVPAHLAEEGSLQLNSAIIIATTEDAVTADFTAYDRRMSRVRWSVTNVGCRFTWLSDNEFAACMTTPGTSTVTFYRRGVPYAEHKISMPEPWNGGFPGYAYGSDGSLAYWFNSLGTNSPITYLDRRGRIIAANITTPEAGTVWYACDMLNRGVLLLSACTGAADRVLHAYKLGRVTEHEGAVHVPSYLRAGIDGAGFYVINQVNPTMQMVSVYNKELTRLQWGNAVGRGSVEQVGPGVYCRSCVDGTTNSYRMVNRSGVFATHVFVRP